MLRTRPVKPFIQQAQAENVNVWCDSKYQGPYPLPSCFHSSVAGDNGSLENHERELLPHILTFLMGLILSRSLQGWQHGLAETNELCHLSSHRSPFVC